MRHLFTCLIILLSITSYAQSVGVGTTTPHPSAALDVSATDQGILIPRTDTSSIAAPAEGLMIFQNTDQQFYFYSGGHWNAIAANQGSKIVDSDADTRVDVESSPDNDEIAFVANNVEVMRHNGQTLEMTNNGQSVFIGELAGAQDDLSENKNVFIGYKTGQQNTTGVQNSAIGHQALNANTSGSNNVGIGQQALFKSNASNNIAIGLNASKETTAGSKNVAIGNFANFANQVGSDNIAIGDEAGRGTASSSTSGNILVGARSGKNIGSGGNVAIGRDALANRLYGDNNIAIGDSAMQAGAGVVFAGFGSNNVAIGSNAGKSITSSRGNTFIGNEAGRGNTSGGFNSTLGYQSGQEMSSGNHNTLVGFGSGNHVTTGVSNVMIGSESGDKSTSGQQNVFIGRRAGFVNTEGSNNIAIGSEAGVENRTGNNNIYLGKDAGRNVINGSNNMYIGTESGKNVAGSNQLIIGNNPDTIPLIVGRFDSLTTQINGALSINDPTANGYQLPKEDGNFGSILRTDGTGEPYWFEAFTTASTGGSGGSIPPTDDSSYDADNYLAAPCVESKYYFEFEDIDGESEDAGYQDMVLGYGLDFSYNLSSNPSNCSNLIISIRKAADKATPKLLQKIFVDQSLGEVFLYQTRLIAGEHKEVIKYRMTNVSMTNLRHETYQRGDGKYSTYEVINLKHSFMEITYTSYDNQGVVIGQTVEEYNCLF